MKLARILLLGLLLAGCATRPVLDTVTSIDSLPHAADLPRNWQLSGRISLTQGETGWHAGVDWIEQAENFRLRVSGPLGQGGFMLSGSPDGVLLQDSAQQVFTAPDTDSLLAEVTGWRLPVAGMRYWVRGVPDPGTAFDASIDDTGRLARLLQDGWTIDYTRYHPVADGRWPARLGLVRDDVTVRMVIDQWQFGAPSTASP
ncbi:MAG: lipoprotein insertase outer membrane protein LolB [Thiohalobacterales bacterium]|nr:lipoprotein insertase outer membrane protein LolB [Thiohalobacterales bacterium]